MDLPGSPQGNLSSELRRVMNDRNKLSMRSRMKVLSALDEDNQKCAAEKKMSLRSQAIQELLSTEVTYLRQLEILMEFFIRPIFERNLLKHALLSTLYENIKTLYNISGELLKELKQDCESVAKAFYKLAPFFKLYSVYAYDYQQVLMLLQTSQENDSTLNTFITNQETRPEVNKKLASLLITPIQRVPRYKLLLKEILQHTPNKHKEYNLLQACLVEVEKAATHINTLVAQNEETQKLLKLQKCITNKINLVKPGRKLIKEGPLMRVSRRGNSAYRRYFILLSDTLLYCKGEPESALTVCCVLPLNKCKVECVLSGGLFRVTCLNETLLLYSEKEDSNLWIQSMQNAIKKYTECRQTLRKDSSSRMPLRHHNIYLFPSETIPNKPKKRKRDEDDDEVCLNSSNIMYFKKDNEDDADGQTENSWSLLFRKFKRFKHSGFFRRQNEDSCVKDMSLQSLGTCTETENAYESRNTKQSIGNIYQMDTSCIINEGSNAGINSRPISSDPEEHSTSSFKNISDFLTYVGISIKEFFRLR